MPSQQQFHRLEGRELAQEARRTFDQVRNSLSSSKQDQFQVLDALTDRVEYAATGQPGSTGQSKSQSPTSGVFQTMNGEALAIQARHVWNQIKNELPIEQRSEAEPIIGALADRVEYVSTGSGSMSSSSSSS
jgi:hypothetical protein